MSEVNENLVYLSPWDFKSYFTCRKILRHGTSGFTSHPRARCAADFIALKNSSPWPDSNTQPLVPVASTLFTTPPRRQGSGGIAPHIIIIIINWSLSGGVHHWLKSRSTREERKPVTRNNNNNIIRGATALTNLGRLSSSTHCYIYSQIKLCSHKCLCCVKFFNLSFTLFLFFCLQFSLSMYLSFIVLMSFIDLFSWYCVFK
jgi:hypothetical protein